jgi:uncharacterized protein (TIGR03435 family)
MKMPVACGALAVVVSAAVSGQVPSGSSPAKPLAFEVASVRPSNPNPSDRMSGMPRLMPVGGRLTVANLPLRVLIRVAYDVQDFQIVGGPSDLLSRKFDITAKAEDGTGRTLKEMSVLLRTLLADRFALKVRTEAREAPIYALVVARKDGALGPAMKVSTSDCAGLEDQVQRRLEMLAREGAAARLKALTAGPIPCAVTPAMAPATGASGFGLRGNGQPMESLVRILTPALGRTLRDETGLMGLYDWELHFDPEVFRQVGMQAGLSPALVAPAPSDSPSLMTALQEQLGLRLDARRGPVEHLIIEHVEAPAPD